MTSANNQQQVSLILLRPTLAMIALAIVIGIWGALWYLSMPFIGMLAILLLTLLLSMTAIGFLLLFSVYARVTYLPPAQRYRVPADLWVRQQGHSFLLWFLAHSTLWTALCFACFFVLARWFGAVDWSIAGMAGVGACSVYFCAGIFSITASLSTRRRHLFGICWQRAALTDPARFLPYMDATVFLDQRYDDIAVEQPQLQRQLSALLARKASSLPSLGRSIWKLLGNEFISRLMAAAGLFIPTFLIAWLLIWMGWLQPPITPPALPSWWSELPAPLQQLVSPAAAPQQEFTEDLAQAASNNQSTSNASAREDGHGADSSSTGEDGSNSGDASAGSGEGSTGADGANNGDASSGDGEGSTGEDGSSSGNTSAGSGEGSSGADGASSDDASAGDGEGSTDEDGSSGGDASAGDGEGSTGEDGSSSGDASAGSGEGSSGEDGSSSGEASAGAGEGSTGEDGSSSGDVSAGSGEGNSGADGSSSGDASASQQTARPGDDSALGADIGSQEPSADSSFELLAPPDSDQIIEIDFGNDGLPLDERNERDRQAVDDPAAPNKPAQSGQDRSTEASSASRPTSQRLPNWIRVLLKP